MSQHPFVFSYECNLWLFAYKKRPHIFLHIFIKEHRDIVDCL